MCDIIYLYSASIQPYIHMRFEFKDIFEALVAIYFISDCIHEQKFQMYFFLSFIWRWCCWFFFASSLEHTANVQQFIFEGTGELTKMQFILSGLAGVNERKLIKRETTAISDHSLPMLQLSLIIILSIKWNKKQSCKQLTIVYYRLNIVFLGLFARKFPIVYGKIRKLKFVIRQTSIYSLLKYLH